MRAAPSRGVVAALAVGPTVGLLLFYVWPFATLLGRAIDSDAITETLGSSRTWRILWFTTWQAVASTVATIAIGTAPAFVVARFDFRGRSTLLGVLTAVFVLPTVVIGAAFLALLPSSLDRTVWAVLGAHVVFNIAVVVRTVSAVWERLPTDMEHAAATLGAGRWRVFTQLTVPLLRPAIGAAAAIIFLFTFTSFGVIRVLGAPGTRTVEVEVWRQATQLGRVDVAAVLTVLQLAVLASAVGWSALTQRRHSRAIGLLPLTTRRRPRGTAERRLVRAIVFTTTAVVCAPLLALVIRSFATPSGWTTSAWTQLGRAEIRPGIRLGIDPVEALVASVQAAAWATLFATVIGGAATLSIAAARRGGRVLDVGLMLPIGTSAVTIGFGMLITFDSPPFDWRASWWLVPIGHALVAVPFVVRTAVSVLRAVDPKLTAAAQTLGASPTRAWVETVVPYLWRPLGVGAALAAAISLGEFGATSFLSRSGRETLPIAIDELVGRTGTVLQAQGYVLATMLAAATILLVVAVERLGRSDR